MLGYGLARKDQLGMSVTGPPTQTPLFCLGSCQWASCACEVWRVKKLVPACLREHCFSAVTGEGRREDPKTAMLNLTHAGFKHKSNLLVAPKKRSD